MSLFLTEYMNGFFGIVASFLFAFLLVYIMVKFAETLAEMEEEENARNNDFANSLEEDHF